MSSGLSLTDGFDLSGMTSDQVYVRYIAVGGVEDPLLVEAHLLGLIDPGSYEHDVVAQALNEHFIELGQDHVVGYVRVTGNGPLPL